MAINLWKVGGKPTSYSPLPLGNNLIILPLYRDYVVKLKAKSASNAILRISSYNGVNDLLQDITLTPMLTEYTAQWKETENGTFNLIDKNNVGDIIIDSIELVQKPLPKPSRNLTKKRALPKAKGLSFNGLTDYLQLPSMTMDSVELECLIDSSQQSLNKNYFDARTGLSSSWCSTSAGNGAGIQSVTGLVFGARTTIRIVLPSVFTDDVTIFSNYLNAAGTMVKGTLYKVRCYLAGQVVAQYDFENSNNLVGDKIIPSAKNLVPSFEDSRWSLHSLFRVLGKDVGRLDSTTGGQDSPIIIPIESSKSYLLTMIGNGKVWVDELNASQSSILGSYRTFPYTFTSNVNTKFLKFTPTSTVAGTFDFIRPQLYELDGKEGTLFGKPTQLKKTSKRMLYSKR